MLRCKTCRRRFSERKGSKLFGSQLSDETVALVFRHLKEGRGIRETARLLDINRNTVVRYRRLLGGRL
jgi:LacI family transcriptional regulator